MPDVFDKIANATPTGGGNYITDGDYLYAIEKLMMRDGHEGTCFIMEFRVLEAKATMDDVTPNKVGTVVSSVQNLTKHESAPGNVKAFIQAALASLGTDPSDVGKPEIMDACSDKQPLRGLHIRNTTYRKAIKKGPNAGKPITLNKWTTLPQTVADLKKQKSELDKLA